MATFALLPGAGSGPWYWHLVDQRLRAAGHDVVAVNLPVDDETAGLTEYAAAALDAIGDREDVAVVAQSLGAFSAPLIAAQRPVVLIVLVAPMTPAPGETAGEWWANTGQPDTARAFALAEGRDPDAPFDPADVFLHDVPTDLADEAIHHGRAQADRPFADPWPLAGWPDVPTTAVVGRRDRLFPPAFQRRVLGERLHIVPDEIDSGHLPALAQPAELTKVILTDFSAAGPV